MIPQSAVLGKKSPCLTQALESSTTNEAKAFEALVQLSVLVRLMSAKPHALVPRHANPTNDEVFAATEIFHAVTEVQNLNTLRDAVATKFSGDNRVRRVVAVPLFDQFPTYDFFVFHSGGHGTWRIAAGYQCKKGTKFPDETHAAASLEEVPLSVWIEGRSPKKQQTGNDFTYGWTLLTKEQHLEFLGESVYNALPPNEISGACPCCQDVPSKPGSAILG